MFDVGLSGTDFSRYAEDCLQTPEKARELKILLDSDDHMFQAAKQAVGAVQHAMVCLTQAVQIICKVNEQVARSQSVTLSGVYIKAMSGQLKESPLLRDLLLAIKKAPSDNLAALITTIEPLCPSGHAEELVDIRDRLTALISEADSTQPMRSEHDIRNDNMRTTVVAQKVHLSRHKSKISPLDEAYSKLVIELHDLIATIFRDIPSPLDLPAHESVVYDLRAPHRAALIPKPRFALERALFSPHDYLSCKCCGVAGNSGVDGEVC